MSLQTSTPNNIQTVQGNGLAVFLQADGNLYLKDTNGKTAPLSDYISGSSGGVNIYNANGVLTEDRIVGLNGKNLFFQDENEVNLLYLTSEVGNNVAGISSLSQESLSLFETSSNSTESIATIGSFYNFEEEEKEASIITSITNGDSSLSLDIQQKIQDAFGEIKIFQSRLLTDEADYFEINIQSQYNIEVDNALIQFRSTIDETVISRDTNNQDSGTYIASYTSESASRVETKAYLGTDKEKPDDFSGLYIGVDVAEKGYALNAGNVQGFLVGISGNVTEAASTAILSTDNGGSQAQVVLTSTEALPSTISIEADKITIKHITDSSIIQTELGKISLTSKLSTNPTAKIDIVSTNPDDLGSYVLAQAGANQFYLQDNFSSLISTSHTIQTPNFSAFIQVFDATVVLATNDVLRITLPEIIISDSISRMGLVADLDGNCTWGMVGLCGYTVATLPPNGDYAPKAGDRAFVTDATVNTYGIVPTGSGALTVPVFFDGANWIIG